jgi:hypothetical protein
MGSGVRRDDAVCGVFAFHKKTVIVRLDRTIQYAATSRFIAGSTGILNPRLTPSLKLRRPTVMSPGEALA